MADEKRIDKTDQFSLLYQITQTLHKTADLKRSLYNMLELLSKSQGMIRGTITILDPFSDEISIEVAHGISRTARQKGKYKLGEGITGQVIQTGDAVTIPELSKDNRFLNRTASRKAFQNQKISFICVPIKKDRRVIGALSVDRPHDESYSLKDGEKLLSVVAAMIAMQVIYLERTRIEKEKLRSENDR
ncbi:MAG: GAF domain-containing protein, partial [Desulfobacterales bacterium]|nr:GAF domain-containing protein [Desulfobacterales bacterium]